MKDEIVILSASRTPIGRILGQFSKITAPQLASYTIKDAMKKVKVTGKQLDEVILGCAVQAGIGQNPARKAALLSGIPNSIGSYTVNKVCGSSLKTIALAAQSIKAGDAEVVLAGGMESMSNAPFLIPNMREGHKYGNTELIDANFNDGLACPHCNLAMGTLAEKIAKKHGITRKAQDKWGLESHKKAHNATIKGHFKKEIIPINGITIDEPIRPNTSILKMSKLRPAFLAKGTITAGNAPGLNDGASSLIVTTARKAKKLGKKPIAVIESYATGHTDPDWFGLAPVTAVKKLMKQTGYKINDFELVEENEAFAVQTLAVIKQLGLDPKKVNVHGGAIALGHPIGASGARILTTLIHSLHQHKKDLGLATLCLGGGGSIAMAIRRVK